MIASTASHTGRPTATASATRPSDSIVVPSRPAAESMACARVAAPWNQAVGDRIDVTSGRLPGAVGRLSGSLYRSVRKNARMSAANASGSSSAAK